MAQLMAEARESAGTRPERQEELPPDAEAVLRDFRERHIRQWLDDSIPALDGLTPREAARKPRAREKLEILLREMEQSEARLPAQQRLDLAWLREALDMTAS